MKTLADTSSCVASVILAVILSVVANPVVAQERVTLTRGTIGCIWRVQEKVREYAIAKDDEAVKFLWLAGITTGECYSFKDGEPIIILEQSLWHNMTRIKKIGAVKDYWIVGQPSR